MNNLINFPNTVIEVLQDCYQEGIFKDCSFEKIIEKTIVVNWNFKDKENRKDFAFISNNKVSNNYFDNLFRDVSVNHVFFNVNNNKNNYFSFQDVLDTSPKPEKEK